MCSTDLSISLHVGSQFGYLLQGDEYISLTNNTILRKNTTLLCITEQFNLQEIQWKYESLNGVITDPPSTTDMREFSTINVTLDQPGIYSCSVSQDGGLVTKVYTAILEDSPGK